MENVIRIGGAIMEKKLITLHFVSGKTKTYDTEKTSHSAEEIKDICIDDGFKTYIYMENDVINLKHVEFITSETINVKDNQ